MTTAMTTTIRTLTLTAGLLLTPFTAQAEPPAAPAPAEVVAALRCEAAGARADMLYFSCLSRCARRAAHGGADDGRCAAACETRKATREARLVCRGGVATGVANGAMIKRACRPGNPC